MPSLFKKDIKALKKMRKQGFSNESLRFHVSDDNVIHSDKCGGKDGQEEIELAQLLADPQKHLHEACYDQLIKTNDGLFYNEDGIWESGFATFMEYSKNRLKAGNFKKKASELTFEENIELLKRLEVHPCYFYVFDQKTYKKVNMPYDQETEMARRNKIIKHLVKNEREKTQRYLFGLPELNKEKHEAPGVTYLVKFERSMLDDDSESIDFDEKWSAEGFFAQQLLGELLSSNSPRECNYWQIGSEFKRAYEVLHEHFYVTTVHADYPQHPQALKISSALSQVQLLTFSELAPKHSGYGFEPLDAMTQALKSVKAL